MTKEVPPEIQAILKKVVDHFDKEDVAVRERQIRTWRRLKLMWEGFYQTWYSEVAHDWRIWDDSESSGDDGQQGYYDKPINVFRAYLESIIAALSVTVPPVKCYPDDADNTLDLSTARTGDKIAQLVYRHNNVSLLWLHALFIYCTEGMVACYSYPKEDDKYGTYEKKHHEEDTEEHEYAKCPECGFTLTDTILSQINPQAAEQMKQQELLKEDEFMPYQDDMETYQNMGSELCPACGAIMMPEVTQESIVVTKLVGITQEPKTRMCLEAYGGLYVKVPVYARKQEECPYLFYMYETHYANAIEHYEHLHGKKGLTAKKIAGSTGTRDPYEEWGRLSPQYQGEYPTNVVTVRNCWLRPSSFNVLEDKDEVDMLRKKYPKGCKVVFVGDEFGEACSEQLDDCWTLTYNPLSDYLHHDPLGLLLVSIQEITNDLISLTLQTVEHGIGQTFADPGVVDFNAYRQTESIPGGLYEAKPKSGQTLANAFHDVKTATLSPEVMPFAQNIQGLAQLVSGALPSLFGGAVEGSGTASEYSMSRAQALQRLQNVWKMLTSWWKEIFGKVIPMYIKETEDQGDDRDVQRDTNGNFINVFLRRAEMEGKIGKVELEANENLPLTWSQQKDIIMQLLQAANPQILEIIGSSENLPVIREAIGLTDFYIPGEDSREKQLDEIKLLLNSEVIPTGDPMMPEAPSIEVDPLYDVHPIEFGTIQSWANSEAGRQAKVDKPEGYMNVLLHGKMHWMNMQQQAMMAPPSEDDGAQTHGEETTETQEAPITGEENVSTV